MNAKKRLNCYVFSNLIISFLSLNLFFNNEMVTLKNIENNTDSTLDLIKGLKEKEVVVNVPSVKTTTISVTKKEVQSKNEITYIKPSYNSVTGSSLVNYAKHYLGLRYISGGYSLTTGTDCSGFTKLIYKEFGINLGRTVKSQLSNGTYVNKSDLKPGDLVFYGYTNYATHVAIYIGSGLVIHESNPGDGVKISSVDMMVYITARRVITASVPNIDKKPVEETKQEEVKEELDSTKNDSVTNKNESLIDKTDENEDIGDEVVLPDDEIENITTDDNQISTNDNQNLDTEKIEDDFSIKEEIVTETNKTDTSNNLESDVIKEEDNNLDTKVELEEK